MAFGSFNNLTSGISRAASNLSGISQSISSVSNNFARTVNQATQQFNNSPLGQTINTARNLNQNINSLLNAGGLSTRSVGSNRRMISNAFQNIGSGASPAKRKLTPAVAAQDVRRSDTTDPGDWRVSLAVPPVISGGPVLAPLSRTGNRMIFPFTPTILFQHSANYSAISPTHSNYPYHAYQNSQVDAITITGDFVNENEEDGQYYIAVIHFLRTMTKMFYGGGTDSGNPPLLSRLKGYGPHVLNDIPVVITTFNIDLPQNVDYIECTVDGKSNYVPTTTFLSVTCQPNYSRRATAGFDLKEFADGRFVGTGQGFI
jgi:hypothetical protein